MGNDSSTEAGAEGAKTTATSSDKPGYKSLFEAGGMVCGSLKDTLKDGSPRNAADTNDGKADGLTKRVTGIPSGLINRAENLCSSSPTNTTVVGVDENTPVSFLGPDEDSDDEVDGANARQANGGVRSVNATSALFARALLSEVSDNNPRTMPPEQMAEREKQLLKAQDRASKGGGDGSRAVGAPGGVGGPSGVLGAVQNFSLTGGGDSSCVPTGKARHDDGAPRLSILPPNPLSENRAQVKPASGEDSTGDASSRGGKYTVTIGLSLSRRHSTVGHPDTVTRQTAFDFNELQDRQYKYVSSTDASGWLAGGGEKGGGQNSATVGGVGPHGSVPAGEGESIGNSVSEDGEGSILEQHHSEFHDETTGGPPSSVPAPLNNGIPGANSFGQNANAKAHKVAAPDTVHIPIIHIDCDSPAKVDAVVASLARGEIFIPHMSILPEVLSVNGISPPDLVVRFGCERNDDVPPDEWPNWCLEFMHNQLYEYFAPMGARWMKRPFQITLARKVRWKTVKHMNKFFAHSERVINAWREKGPQYLDPQLSYIEGGATPEEVSRPHGIYLLRNGVPTNYFAPNFEPPYTTKMTRSLLLNVIGKSWDKKRRDWTSEPVPKVITPAMLLSTMCGCADPGQGGFIASEATKHASPLDSRVDTARNGSLATSHSVTNKSNQLRQEKLPQENKDLVGQEERPQNIMDGAVAVGAGPTADAAHPTSGSVPMNKSRSTSSSHSGATSQSVQSSSKHSDKSADAGEKEPQHKATAAEHEQQLPSVSNVTDIRDSIDGDAAKQSSETIANQHQSNLDSSQPRTSPTTRTRSSPVRGRPSPENPIQKVDSREDAHHGDDKVTASPPPKQRTKEKSPAFNKNGLGSGRDTPASQISITSSPAALGASTMPTHSAEEEEPPKSSPPPRQPDSKTLNSRKSNENVLTFEEEMSMLSTAPSQGGLSATMSIGESHTTVPIANGGGRLIEMEREKRKEREKEREEERRKMEALELALQEQLAKGKVADKEKDQGSSKSKKKDKKEKKKEKRKKEKEKEREKQIALIALAAEETERAKAAVSRIQEAATSPRSTGSDGSRSTTRGKKEPAPTAPSSKLTPRILSPKQGDVMRRGNSPPSATEGVQRCNSQVSLEYSVDSSLLGDGSLLGGQYATDGSVVTVGTSATANQSLLSYVTRSTVGEAANDQRNAKLQKPQKKRSPKPPEDDDISLSILESSSSLEQVPTDEELFTVGWAKALDPNSGSYYYFTLDRSKTVWENPLASGEVEGPVPGSEGSSASGSPAEVSRFD